MDPKAAPFDPDAGPGATRPIIRRNPDAAQEVEMVEATWGSDPRFAAGNSYRFVRSDRGDFSRHRCLVPASEFHMHAEGKNYRVTLDGGNFFYLAAVWEPAMAGWPLSFRIVTVDANHDVGPYQPRHGAIILRRQVMQWLDLSLPESTLLATPPVNTFRVEEIGRKPEQIGLPL
jgi:putative SOS response-associated peptidase YedK